MGASFEYASLDGCRFSDTTLTFVSFRYARLLGVTFTGAVLTECSFASAALGGTRHDDGADFTSAFVENCDFDGASLYAVVFADATLVGQNILTVGAAPGFDLADFSNAYLPDVDFTGASLRGARLGGAFMVGCILDRADLSSLDGSRTVLASACLQGVSFTSCALHQADLTDAMIVDVRGRIEQQYYDRGVLTPLEHLYYRATALPDPASFDADTICPNGLTYGTNQERGHTLAEMMTATHPRRSWVPVDRLAPPGLTCPWVPVAQEKVRPRSSRREVMPSLANTLPRW